MSCGVYVWEPGAEELWELPYYRTWWHLPIPDGIQATRFALPNGLAYECLEPLTAYRVTYADGDAMRLDMTFRAIHPPHEVGVVPGGHGHLDQLGRVTGELWLGGERVGDRLPRDARPHLVAPPREPPGHLPHLQLRGGRGRLGVPRRGPAHPRARPPGAADRLHASATASRARWPRRPARSPATTAAGRPRCGCAGARRAAARSRPTARS